MNVRDLRKQKNVILIASIIFAFAVAIIAALSIDGNSYRPIIIMIIAIAYLVFMLLNNMHCVFLYKDEVDDLLEETKCLGIYRWK